MLLPWRRRTEAPTENPEPQPEKPDVERARRLLHETKARRPEVERKAALMRWHLQENDFRRRVLGLIEEGKL